MGLAITGYVLEPIRVGAANATTTWTPDIVVIDQLSYDAAYPSNESQPRTDYLAFVMEDGKFSATTISTSPSFGWTKNEVLNRFSYNGKLQRFQPLSGAPIESIGTLEADANTNRLVGDLPISTNTSDYPIRISLGSGSGVTFTVVVVVDDLSFSSPPSGTVEISQSSGNLNWNNTDVATYLGQDVRLQRQTFFTPDESNGNLGLIDGILLLNPLPAAGQHPLIRIGFGEYLLPVERINESAFLGNPTTNTVEWARDTGRLKFNSGDIAANTGKSVYFDGVVFGFSTQMPTDPLGTVLSPGTLSAPADEESDIFFTVPGVVTFEETVFVDSFSTFGRKGQVEIRRSDSAVQFSIVDKALYGSLSVTAVTPDLPIERGMAVRFKRTATDPAGTDATSKDVAAFYESTGATLADPLIGAPYFYLPAVPVDSLSIAVHIEQGTGTYTLASVPRLDVPSPPVGYGYVIDSEAGTIRLGRRRVDVVVPQSVRVPYSSVQLPDPGLFASGLVIELEDPPGGATFTTLPATIDGRNLDVVTNLDAGLVTLTETDGISVTSGSLGFFSGSTTFTDTSKDFTAAGVLSGDYLVISAGAAAGVYTIDSVGTTTLVTDLAGAVASNITYEIFRGSEILADRYFREIPPLDPNTRVERLVNLGVTENVPRLVIDVAEIDRARFRFGKTGSLITPTQVATDGAFTSPASLTAGNIEVSLSTGNLNFSQTDVNAALDIYWAKTLTIGTEFQVNATLGFIEFTDRMLENEEVFLTYARINDNDEKEIIEERGTFIVRKEITADHPAPISTLSFNPLGREVASLPPPQAFRGGRPQVTGTQVSFNTTASTVTFLPTQQVTNALPYGATVNPDERVYIDYFVYGAVGGEKSLTVLQPPFLGVTITITAGETEFTIAGDRTGDFKANYLLRIDREEIYLLAGSSYDSVEDLTTITIAAPQTFRSDYRNPTLAVTSGQTRPLAAFFFPSYFVTELATFETAARGQNRFKLVGDHARTYRTGIVVQWSGTGSTDYNYVEGSVYDAETNRTTVTLSSNGARQYTAGLATLKRSLRPILTSPSASVSTSKSPDLSQPYIVWRRVEGEIGQVLVSPDDYTINSAGQISFTDPLQENEELTIFYTGFAAIEDGRDLRASYSHLVVPSTTNGIANQVLTIDYTTYAPDTVYWRVETMTNFRAEIAKQYGDDAQSSTPTGGPRLENASQPRLYEQGRESLAFQEKHLANEDLVARGTLKWYNDGVNLLEDALQSLDGRVVGDHDGRFLFDGNIDNPVRASVADATNHIDDRLKVAVRATITFPPFAVVFQPVYQAMYKPSRFSRLYPTKRRLYGVSAGPGSETGDTLMATDFGSWSKVDQISRRLPWAVTTAPANIGDTVLQVDDADGAEDLLRPAFDAVTYTHRVAIVTQDGTVLAGPFPGTPLDVSASTATTITLSAPLLFAVPVGSTVYQVPIENPLSPSATPFPRYYRLNWDLGASRDEGELLYIKPFPPFDGSFFTSAPNDSLNVVTPPAGEVIDVAVGINNPLTEPDRVPALDGSTQDDDRNRQFPILTPSATSENGTGVGYIQQEQALVETGGKIRSITTPPFVGTGSLSLGNTRITLDSGTFPAPVPKINDLVRILTGTNAGLDFRRVTATDGSTYVQVTGGDAWPTADSAFSFTVAVSASLESGVAALTLFITITDAGATFITNGVKPGHTVVATSGVNLGLRRQVLAVSSETVLITAPWPANDAAMAYVVDDPLSTFGGAPNSLVDAELVPSLNGELAVLSTNVPPSDVYNQRDALELFLDNFLTDILTSTTGQTTATGTTLTDTSVDFVAAGVTSAYFIFVRSGDNAGAYAIDSVTGANSLEVLSDNPFPDTTVVMDYRIVNSGGLSLKTLQDVQSVLASVDNAIVDTTAFLGLVTTTVSVLGDASAHALDWLLTDLVSREAEITARLAEIETAGTGAVDLLSSVMSSGDRLYDRRYVWIDARTNLETGILSKQERAVSKRIKAEANIVKQLTKVNVLKLLLG